MILTYRDVAALAGPWYLLELLSEDTLDLALRRLCESIPGIFRGSPMKMFIPIDRANGFALHTGSYVYLQSDDFHALARLKRVRGVVGLVTLGGVNDPRAAIRALAKDIEPMIQRARLEYAERAEQIQPGCFVRILDGAMRDYCGDVIEVKKRWCSVRITTETRILLVKTLAGNLLCVPKRGSHWILPSASKPPRP